MSSEAGRLVAVQRPAPGVVELRLDRPHRRNAVTTALLRQLRDELVALTDDRHAKVVVLSGSPPTFCAGADLAEFGDGPIDPADSLARVRLVIACVRGLLELEQITIAAVDGAAVGAGWGLALACHTSIAGTSTTFSLPEVAKGFRVPRVIVTRLAQVVGPVRAAELILSGRAIDATEAHAIGAVGRVLPDGDDTRAEALELAASLATRPRPVLRGAVDPLRTLSAIGPTPELDYQWPER